VSNGRAAQDLRHCSHTGLSSSIADPNFFRESFIKKSQVIVAMRLSFQFTRGPGTIRLNSQQPT
jgi:hypothetical protein